MIKDKGENMKRILSWIMAFATAALAASTLAASFTPGNLIIYRKGDGTTLTNTGNIVFLDEYTTNNPATLVQSVMMPTNYFGANSPLLEGGTDFGDGLLTRSADGRFIALGGLGALLGQATNFSIGSAGSTEIPRVVAVVDGSGRVDSTTTQTNSLVDSEVIRGVTTSDGTNIWFAGGNGGIRYTPRGGHDATQLNSVLTNIRQVNIFSNQLYFSDSSGGSFRVGTVGSGLPTTAGQTLANLPGYDSSLGSPWQFVLFKLTGGSDPFDTLWVADAAGQGAIYKWSLVSGNWVSNGFITAAGAVGLTGQLRVDGSGVTNVDLFITGGGTTFSGGNDVTAWHDSTGYNADPGPGDTGSFILTSASAGKSFRGIAFAPVGTEPFPNGPGVLSVGPVLGFFSSGLTGCSDPSTLTYSLANLGSVSGGGSIGWTASVDSNWVSLSQSSGTLPNGGSTTVIASLNANVSALLTGTNTALITFTNTSSPPNDQGSTTRAVRETLTSVNLLPASAFASSGSPGGPFSSTNKVYTLTNGATAFNYTVNMSPAVTWLTLSSTNGSVGSCAGVNITASLNANANALDIGNFSTILVFSNKDSNTLIDTRNVTLVIGSVYYFDDFSTYSQNQDLNGQKGWIQVGSNSGNPLQVTNGAVVFPAGLTGGSPAAYQSVVKDFPLITNPVTYVGMVMTVDTAVTNSAAGLNQTFGGPSFIAALYTGHVIANDGSTVNTFSNYRLTARSPDYGTQGTFGGGSNFFLGVRSNGQAGAPWTYGSTAFPTGQILRVIQKSDVNSSNAVVYVNPTSTNEGANAIYVTGLVTGSGYTADPGVGAWGMSQFGTVTGTGPIPSDGARFFKVAAATNFADVFNFITNPFIITSITRSGNNIVLNWNGALGSNIVQVSTSPNNFAGTYIDLATTNCPHFGPASYTDVGGATNNPNRYYRIKGGL